MSHLIKSELAIEKILDVARLSPLTGGSGTWMTSNDTVLKRVEYDFFSTRPTADFPRFTCLIGTAHLA